MKKAIYLIIFAAVIFYLWNDFTHYTDSASGCRIKIATGLEFNNRTIKRGLEALKYGYPEKYALVCQNVGTIRTGIACGGFGGGCYHPGMKGQIYVSTAQGAVLESAAIIVHEYCHLNQEREGRKFIEDECYREDDEVFKTLVQF